MSKLINVLFVVFAEMLISASPAKADKLAPPTDFLATPSAKIDGAVELSWHPVKGATAYTISASRETDGNWQIVGTTAETAFQLNEMPANTRYYFRIASSGKSGQGVWSSSVIQTSSGAKRIHSLRLPLPGLSAPHSTWALSGRRVRIASTGGIDISSR